ncbi:MAG: peptidyl-prolyl cis-trans isomerase [Bryobacterales bacterium]|nr:peptidyl-prolyl cis-trans isomerase [Bryobacterales bacterium]
MEALKNICLVLAIAGSLWGAKDAEPEIVARVNGEPVTKAELQRTLASLERQEADSKALERVVLQNLIHRRLILQEAARRSLTVTEKDQDKALASLRRRFEDLKSLGAWMREQGLDDRSLHETLRDGMLVARVTAALVEKVRVAEEQVEQHYAAHKEDLKTEEVWIQIIAVKEKAAAEEIQAALRKGEDFGRLAQQRSRGLRATRGGDVGWVNSETLWPAMREAVGTLKPGQAVGPLERGEEFLVVRLHQRRPGRTKTLDEARSEIEASLLTQKQQEAIQAWLAEQEKKSKVEVFPPTTAGKDRSLPRGPSVANR